MADKRLLGRTSIQVTPIGLGCWQFSRQKNLAGRFWPSIGDETINRVVSLSLEGGINWFDTAEIYGDGASEVALNWLIHFHGDTVVAIPGATKEHHVKENTGAISFRLSDEELAQLDQVSAVFRQNL